jgi:DNA (cytosine-5)-methyltransferase 1
MADEPLNTITCSHGTHSVIMPFITRYNGGEERNHGTDAPLPVIDCSNRYGLIEPLFIPQQSGGTVKATGAPFPTIATSGAIGLVEPLIIKYFGSETSAKGIKAPLDTITTRDRFGLVQGRILTMPDWQRYRLDITHRMLTAAELARATSFPEGYVFCGGDTAAKKQIGNAVPPVLAEAIYRAILAA